MGKIESLSTLGHYQIARFSKPPVWC